VKHLISVCTLCSALLFCASIPCRAGVIDFSNDGLNDISSDISLFDPSTIPGIDTIIGIKSFFDVYNGTTGFFLEEEYCSTTAECEDLGYPSDTPINEILVTGTVPGATGTIDGTGNSAPLVAITLSGPLTGTSFANPPSPPPYFTGYDSVPVSSIAVNPQLLAALGLSPSTTFSLTVDDVNIGGQNGNYTTTQSADLDLSTGSVPEPGSWLLVTSGILLTVVAARRRSRVRQ